MNSILSRRRGVRFAIALFGILLAVFAASIIGAQLYLGGYLAREITDRGRASGFNIAFTEPGFKLGRFTARSLDLFLPRALLSLSTGDLVVTPSYLSLVRGITRVSVRATTYGGELDAVITQGPGGGEITVTGEMNNLDLSDHPQLAGVGITEGHLTTHAQELTFGPKPFPSLGSFSIALVDIAKPRASILPGDLYIPSFQELSLRIKGRAEAKLLHFEEIHLESPLGEATGVGSLDHGGSSGVLAFSLGLDIKLTDAGTALLGQFLPSLSEGRVAADARTLRVEITGERGRVVLRFLPSQHP